MALVVARRAVPSAARFPLSDVYYTLSSSPPLPPWAFAARALASGLP